MHAHVKESRGNPTPHAAITPPLKWAGGKRWLVQKHPEIFPSTYKNYYEPFAGSAAVFFHLTPQRAFLADKNADLIETYIALRDQGAKVFNLLTRHQEKHSEDYYYIVRTSKPRSLAAKAARFVYLNRTCFNGLYRVNQRGQFNVPKGSKDKVILDTDDFAALARVLNNANFLNSDFEEVIDMANAGDFIFVDPPYTVMHASNGFVKYNEVLFSWNDQVRLAKCLAKAKNRGAIILSTNADHPSIKKLYKGIFRIKRLERNSLISGDSLHRKSVGELLIASY